MVFSRVSLSASFFPQNLNFEADNRSFFPDGWAMYFFSCRMLVVNFVISNARCEFFHNEFDMRIFFCMYICIYIRMNLDIASCRMFVVIFFHDNIRHAYIFLYLHLHLCSYQYQYRLEGELGLE